MKGRSLLLLACLLCSPAIQAAAWSDWWLTPDQQGQRLFNSGDFAAAAEIFEDVARKGAAYYRAGDFENAASVFGRMRTSEAAFNRGNALVLLGSYDEAINSYEAALVARPGWVEARKNRDIARARAERLKPSGDDAGGTGGQLEADEIVFDDSGRVNQGGTEVEMEADGAASEEAMRAVWLRRVGGDPSDFLRARFAYQLYRDAPEMDDDPVEP